MKIFHNACDPIVATQKKNVWSLQFEHFTILRVCGNFQIQLDWVTFHEATRLERWISYLKQVHLRWICLKENVFSSVDIAKVNFTSLCLFRFDIAFYFFVVILWDYVGSKAIKNDSCNT